MKIIRHRVARRTPKRGVPSLFSSSFPGTHKNIPPAPEAFYGIIAQRTYYLQSIGLPSTTTLKAELWSGSALHLLELTQHITPSMRAAADFYAQLSKRVVDQPLSHTLSRMDGTWSARESKRSKIPVFRDTPDTEDDRRYERTWRDLSHILTRHGIHNTLTELGVHNNLDLTRRLLKEEHPLHRLKQGLYEAALYIQERDRPGH